MAAAGPFADGDAVFAAAMAAFGELAAEDWLEAFAHHPRIGDVSKLRERFAASGELSEKEQGTAVAAAADDTIQRLFELNQAYEARHGHIFIVCATGKSAAEMLALLEARLGRDPVDELQTCAEEQMKITGLRLAALIEPAPSPA
ncbi:MAG: 2-oxo-4-hydroxy-4-carboxy-5-ureidoimidazoline decarboxylase [Deltaproteobacteria bacterium]|nr:2-oxo-4-hydroxy-4-carboxy-5-ureidoimidazoline decarboxylase [Deltaproteobacteria bacterium]